MENYDQQRKLILTGNISRVILTLAGPIMLNNFTQTIYNLTDTFWVSRLGGVELAAMTLVWPVIFLIISIGVGMNIAGTALISQHVGAGDQQKAVQISGQLLSFSVLFSLIFGMLGALSTGKLVGFMGGTGDLLAAGSSYLRIMFMGMPSIFLFIAFTSIKQGQGDTLTPMKYSAISVIMNIILDPIFIFTFKLGISGAALATIISRAVFALYAIYTLFSREDGIKINRKSLMIVPDILKKIIKIGLPASIGQSTTALGFTVMNIFIISFGTSTMAAFGIGNRINSLILMPAMGIGNALVTIVGQNLGADQTERARKAIKTSTFLTTLFLVGGGILFYPLIPTIVGFFSREAVISSQAIYYLRLITVSLPLMGFLQVFIGAFQGSGHTVIAMLLMGGRLWAFRIPMILLFKRYTSWGSSSIWYAMIISNALIALLGFIFYLTGRWEKKVIKTESAQFRVGDPLPALEEDRNRTPADM